MNAQPNNEINYQDPMRSMNSYLQRQSRKSTSLFEGNGHVSDLVEEHGQDRHGQEWAQMEARLQRSRERIEKAITAVKMASANAAQFDDDEMPIVSMALRPNH